MKTPPYSQKKFELNNAAEDGGLSRL